MICHRLTNCYMCIIDFVYNSFVVLLSYGVLVDSVLWRGGCNPMNECVCLLSTIMMYMHELEGMPVSKQSRYSYSV